MDRKKISADLCGQRNIANTSGAMEARYLLREVLGKAKCSVQDLKLEEDILYIYLPPLTGVPATKSSYLPSHQHRSAMLLPVTNPFTEMVR